MGWREEVELISWEMKRWIIIAMAAKAVVFCPLRSVKKKKKSLECLFSDNQRKLKR